MAEVMKDVLGPGEIELFIRTMEPSDIKELGSPSWFKFHEHVQKLHQQALVEAKELREETVKDTMITHNKIPILVHEVICISIWTEKVLPRLLKSAVEAKSSFIPYMVLFHEATCIEFLAILLYHDDSCEALGEASLELIDYSASAIAKLLAKIPEKSNSDDYMGKNAIENLQEKQITLAFSIGMQCISILGCIAQHLDSLPLSATSRVFTTNDTPILLASLIETKPWLKVESSGKTLKFEDNVWSEVKGEAILKISRAEAQTWLALRQLLLDPRCPAHYDINEYRKNQLTKLLCYLQDSVVDQLSPLIDLKYWLAQLSTSNPPSTLKKPLIMEVIPQFREKINKKNSKRWSSIANKHAAIMFSNNEEQMKAIINSLTEAYDVDTMEALAVGPATCVLCGEPAPKKCSRCKAASYCGRECQVKNWPKHKSSCDFLVSKKENTN